MLGFGVLGFWGLGFAVEFVQFCVLKGQFRGGSCRGYMEVRLHRRV